MRNYLFFVINENIFAILATFFASSLSLNYIMIAKTIYIRLK